MTYSTGPTTNHHMNRSPLENSSLAKWRGDTLTGSSGDDQLWSGLGGDVLDDGPGGDTLRGNSQNGTLRGGGDTDNCTRAETSAQCEQQRFWF